MRTLIIWSDSDSFSTHRRSFDMAKKYEYDLLHVSQLENLSYNEYDKIILQRIGGNKYKLNNKEKELIYNILSNHDNVHFDIDDLCVNCDVSNFMKMSKTVRVASERLGEQVKYINPNIELVENIVIGEFKKIDMSKKISFIIPSDYLCDHWLNNAKIPEWCDVFYIGSMPFTNLGIKKLDRTSDYNEYLSYLHSCDYILLPISDNDKYVKSIGIDYISSKSRIKQTEAEYVGTPIVASNLIPAFEDGPGCRVCSQYAFFQGRFLSDVLTFF